MNLSKTEKLLAAKKKLKEFQQSKKQVQEKRQSNDTPKSQCSAAEEKNSNEEQSKDFVQEAPQETPVIAGIESTREPVPFSEDSRKEHLLELVSAVNEVLSDGPEQETELEVDAKQREQFLSSHIEQQNVTINRLHVQLAEYQDRVSELQGILAGKDTEFESKLLREINPLKEQLEIHTRTTGILIAEKAELTAALEQSQNAAKRSTEEMEELSGKLKRSQARVSELEKELASVRNTDEEAKKKLQQIDRDYEKLKERHSELRRENEELSLEVSELKQKLNLKNTEFVGLQQELQEKIALLSLNELRIQQLTNASETFENQQETVMQLEHQLSQTKETLKMVNDEKEEAAKRYRSYVRQLEDHRNELTKELESGQKIIADLEARERGYVERLAELERQLQQEKQKNEASVSSAEKDMQMENLTRSLHELTMDQERLHLALAEKENEIEALMKELRELEERREERAEASKLVQALESEQLGASRAISQNQKLKEDLNEMQNAFVSLSNAKLDLTEQLQAERNIGRKLNARLNEVETELETAKKKLKEKEESLIEMEKEKLQNAQITDRMQHYQAQSHYAHTLQEELQNALASIETLKKENGELQRMLQEKEETPTKESLNAVKETTEETLAKECFNSIDERAENNAVELEYPEPIKKLEKRFKETMEKVAELTDEKQRLEHLVLQLQGETETIGEYITLYQKQRAILQSRAREREEAFRQLLEQRNIQQEQLHKLKVLVSDLMKNQGTSTQSDPILNHKGENEIEQVETKDMPEETKSMILDLLTEIKDCKDVPVFEGNFHPCPWCSGKLITV